MLGGPNVLFPTISKCVLIAVEQISFLHGQEILLAGFSGNHLVLSFTLCCRFLFPSHPFSCFPGHVSGFPLTLLPLISPPSLANFSRCPLCPSLPLSLFLAILTPFSSTVLVSWSPCLSLLPFA